MAKRSHHYNSQDLATLKFFWLVDWTSRFSHDSEKYRSSCWV